MVFIDKWSLFGSYFVIFNQGKVTEVWPLLQGGLYSEVAFNIGLTVITISDNLKLTDEQVH